MLKAHVHNEIWLIQQPHHAQVSGYLAAHWGGPNGFIRPGFYPGATDPNRWRDEVVLGIAEHDNGWWETEAMPRISPNDGLPVGVGEAAPPTEDNELGAWITGGYERWHLGIDRLATLHPYSALLTSMHAYWLYAVAFDDLINGDIDARRHFVFGPPEVAEGLVSDRHKARAFLEEMVQTQRGLRERIGQDPVMSGALRPEHLDAHFRLLQLLDSMSLYLALNDTDTHELHHVPRAGWDDRVTIRWSRLDDRTIGLDPYPFDTEGLVVSMPARVVEDHPQGLIDPDRPPLSRLHGAQLRPIDFLFVPSTH